MVIRKKQFIAGAICPNCSDMDSLVLYVDDQSVECVICEYTQTSEQRDQQANQSQIKPTTKADGPSGDTSSKAKKAKYNATSLINITQLRE